MQTLKIDVLSCEDGWIDVKFTVGKIERQIEISYYPHKPFGALKKWLEDIVCGAKKAQFKIEVEYIDELYFEFKKIDDKYCKFKLISRYFGELILAKLEIYQLIKAFYDSFLSFANSDKYNVKENEFYTFAQKFEDEFGLVFKSKEVLQTLAMFNEDDIHAFYSYFIDYDIKTHKKLNLYENIQNTINLARNKNIKIHKIFEKHFYFLAGINKRMKLISELSDIDISEWGFDLLALKSQKIDEFLALKK